MCKKLFYFYFLQVLWNIWWSFVKYIMKYIMKLIKNVLCITVKKLFLFLFLHVKTFLFAQFAHFYMHTFTTAHLLFIEYGLDLYWIWIEIIEYTLTNYLNCLSSWICIHVCITSSGSSIQNIIYLRFEIIFL